MLLWRGQDFEGEREACLPVQSVSPFWPGLIRCRRISGGPPPIPQRPHSDNLNAELSHPLPDPGRTKERVFLGTDIGKLGVDNLEVAGRVEMHGKEAQPFRNLGKDRAISFLSIGLARPWRLDDDVEDRVIVGTRGGHRLVVFSGVEWSS